MMTEPVQATGGRGGGQIRPHDVEVFCDEDMPRSSEKNIGWSKEKKKALRARYSYGFIFMITNLCAWFVRDYGQRVLAKLPYYRTCGSEGHDCYHTLGVLRVSLGCFIYFFLMFLTTINTKKLYEARNNWHSGWWMLKFLLLVVSMVAPFFSPPSYIQLYGELARGGAGIFLLLQLVSIMEFIMWWNNYWMPNELSKQSCWKGLFMSTVFYIASICGIGLLFSRYASTPECSLNMFFITWTVILLIVMMAISLNPKVNRGILSSGIMAIYVVFLCWTALKSEPGDKKCNVTKQNEHVDWMTVVSFLIAICAVVMATFSTGIDSQSFQFRKNDVQLEDDIPYGYGFFHLIFSLGSMYFAMLFINWNLEKSAKKWSMDVGWASTWVKIVNEWFAASIYLWKLISPVIRRLKVANEELVVSSYRDESTLP